MLTLKEHIEICESESYRLNDKLKKSKNELATVQESYEQTQSENQWYFWSIVILLIVILAMIAVQFFK